MQNVLVLPKLVRASLKQVLESYLKVKKMNKNFSNHFEFNLKINNNY